MMLGSGKSPHRLPSPWAHYAGGFVHALSGAHTEARNELQASLDQSPNPRAQLLLGLLYADEGFLDKAIGALEAVVRDFPDSDAAVEAVKALAELRAHSQKSKATALALSLVLDYAGIDRFYLGNWKRGFLKLATAGGFGIWWVWDILLIATGRMRDARGMRLKD
jgi:TolA-binding protein